VLTCLIIGYKGFARDWSCRAGTSIFIRCSARQLTTTIRHPPLRVNKSSSRMFGLKSLPRAKLHNAISLPFESITAYCTGWRSLSVCRTDELGTSIAGAAHLRLVAAASSARARRIAWRRDRDWTNRRPASSAVSNPEGRAYGRSGRCSLKRAAQDSTMSASCCSLIIW
jgi:hypothetical protein